MATTVILPALGMSQETGKIVRWLKAEGEQVTKGEPLVEIETDKATVEIEAPASGLLSNVSASNGAEVPVGQSIAIIVAAGEATPDNTALLPAANASPPDLLPTRDVATSRSGNDESSVQGEDVDTGIGASRLAQRIMAEHNVDSNAITPAGKRIQKADVMSYLERQGVMNAGNGTGVIHAAATHPDRLLPASPKARRLAQQYGVDLALIKGSGPDGAVVVADVQTQVEHGADKGLKEQGDDRYQGDGEHRPYHQAPAEGRGDDEYRPGTATSSIEVGGEEEILSTIWRIMAERTTQSWTSIPHFSLLREVRADRLITWRQQLQKRGGENVTYTDLLVKVVAAVLREHPRLNACWNNGTIVQQARLNIGLAVAVSDGLIVPVIADADKLSVREIAQRRRDLVERTQKGKIRPEDLAHGTFTISNLGMYGVDAFNAIINAPQAAILAVGRIAERVVPVDGQPGVQPMMILTLSCDHRVVDGARGAQFLEAVANVIEEPLKLLS